MISFIENRYGFIFSYSICLVTKTFQIESLHAVMEAQSEALSASKALHKTGEVCSHLLNRFSTIMIVILIL